jgi:glycosyltransferase involved in cell wall biosynthesis
MKIAFDSTVLHGKKSGIGYYCAELLNAMLDIDQTNQFFVFSHTSGTFDSAEAHPNVQRSNSRFFPIRALYLHALLPKVLDQVQPDICHYTNFLAPIREERPYVVTIHDMGLEVLRDSHSLGKRVYTRHLVPGVARRARLVLTNSEFSKSEIVKHLGIDSGRIRVTPLAASAEFVPCPTSVETPYFLYVGNIEPRKNLERLIEAFARIPLKAHQLWIVGNDLYRGDVVREKARALGLQDRVKFLGYVDRLALPALFSDATAFVYPSLLEGFGMPVVEAMACGAPVITSNSSSLCEIAREAALLIDPLSSDDIAEAMLSVAEDNRLRRELSRTGLARAAEFSWTRTAELTLEAYHEALGASRCLSLPSSPAVSGHERIAEAIHKTVDYAALFQYPLKPEELHERLFDVKVDATTFQKVLKRLRLTPNDHLLELRRRREQITDEAIGSVSEPLRILVSLPFVRMVAFSGSTAHRNMTGTEDIDLFMIVEDGKLWAVFLIAVVWAKIAGLRKRLCMNYLISDAALPLCEQDVFTAQQAAALKPFYGKAVYDRFIERNSFIRRYFPNFSPDSHRNLYKELQPGRAKRVLETLLGFGPIQLLEAFSRVAMGRHLRSKMRDAACDGDPDVQLTRRRLKLHMRSHKRELLAQMPELESLTREVVPL